MKKIIYYLANAAKLVGQLLSLILTFAYVAILVVFSATLILPSQFQEKQIYDFINKFTTSNIATELTALAYSPDKVYTFIIILLLIIVLIGLLLYRFRTALIIAGIPALSLGFSLLNINFFYGIVAESLPAEDLLVFEDIKEKILSQSKTSGLFFTVFGLVASALGIYLFVRNQKKQENESIKSVESPVIEKIDFDPISIPKAESPTEPNQTKDIKSNIFCPNCNTEYEVDSSLCSKCGQIRVL